MHFYKRFVSEKLDENGTLVEFHPHLPENYNFGYDVVDAIAAETPNKRAMVWCNNFGDEREFSFDDISKLSNRAANVFAAHGIKKGDRVMLLLKRHYEYWYAIVGLHKLGAIAIPATHSLSKKDLTYRINAVGISSVVATPDQDTADHLDAIRSECPSLKNLFIVRQPREGFINFTAECEAASDKLERVPTLVTEPMILYFTSGTTGQPKAVMHDHSYTIAHIVTARHWQNVQQDGLHLSISDTGWGKASWGKIYGQWLSGSAVMVYDYDGFSPRSIIHVIKKYGVNTFCAPPTVYRYFIRLKIKPGDFGQLSYVLTAGEALNPEVAYKFEELTGLKIHEGFGQTESTLMLAHLVGQEPNFHAMGKPTPLYNIELLKDDGTFAGTDEVGEIVVIPRKGEPQYGVFMGYCGDDEEYEKVWEGGIYHTRDLATRDKDGYYHYVSRTDDVIKSCGFRISPFEIESALMEHPAVMECAVTGIPDPGRGNAIKATIVCSPDYTYSAELENEIKDYCHNNMAPYKCPRFLEFVDEMPKTVSGKIRRVAIRAADAEKAQCSEE